MHEGASVQLCEMPCQVNELESLRIVDWRKVKNPLLQEIFTKIGSKPDVTVR